MSSKKKSSRPQQLNYHKIEQFTNPKSVPKDIEEEVLTCYVDFNIEHDMTIYDLQPFFEKLQLPHNIYKFVMYKGEKELCVEGTNIIDFDKLLIETYHLLIYMDNVAVIDEYWSLLVESCQRDQQFPQVKLKDHVIGLKQLRAIINNVNGSGEEETASGSTMPLIQMMKAVSSPPQKSGADKLFINYLDFAFMLGKIGLLKFL
ncbi:hypothetical protein ACO0RG_002328 [Hanseniaspora osmophila]